MVDRVEDRRRQCSGTPPAATVVTGRTGGPGGPVPGTAPAGWERRPATTSDIHYDVAEGMAKLTIARPEVRNAFRPQTLFELADAFNRARDDPSVGRDHPHRRGAGRLLLGR